MPLVGGNRNKMPNLGGFQFDNEFVRRGTNWAARDGCLKFLRLHISNYAYDDGNRLLTVGHRQLQQVI